MIPELAGERISTAKMIHSQREMKKVDYLGLELEMYFAFQENISEDVGIKVKCIQST